jgi:hypothetical protein
LASLANTKEGKVKHKNFYETLKEALMRLRRTVIVYDGIPYRVITITNHMEDEIFRVYLEPIGQTHEEMMERENPQPDNYPPEHPEVGKYMDKFIETHPTYGILRKQINSPKFNNFRPYPLGMCNLFGSGTYYVERQPNRKTEQGLISSMLHETPITTGSGPQTATRCGTISVYGPEFKACVMGEYPTAAQTLAALLDPEVTNEAGGFHREFALVRGPIDMIFLAYRHDVVGVLPFGDFSVLKLGRKFGHCREVIDELGLFSTIR